MQKIENDLNNLGARIDFLLDTYHQIRGENDNLKEKIISMDNEILSLKEELQKKESDYLEVSKKLEKFLS
ncbi:hypothetical protein ThvES_00004900 [Thiovulum sp. ES]|nr:hypothetical protein ThvES_00004900 [Thiovulum sp. ES]